MDVAFRRFLDSAEDGHSHFSFCLKANYTCISLIKVFSTADMLAFTEITYVTDWAGEALISPLIFGK
jgi:hypothetical protein